MMRKFLYPFRAFDNLLIKLTIFGLLILQKIGVEQATVERALLAARFSLCLATAYPSFILGQKAGGIITALLGAFTWTGLAVAGLVVGISLHNRHDETRLTLLHWPPAVGFRIVVFILTCGVWFTESLPTANCWFTLMLMQEYVFCIPRIPKKETETVKNAFAAMTAEVGI